MPVLNIHNAWEGCSVLVEYRGTASSPVYLELATVNNGVAAVVANRTIVTDVNGFAHWVYDASALAAGTILQATAVG